MTCRIDYLDINDLRIAGHWTSERSPAPLVFLHGLGDSSIMTFFRIATHPALASMPALLIDLPGFGHSDAPADWPATIEHHAAAVASVLDALGITGAPISGHSMGGSTALVLAASRPDLVSRLVLAEPLLRREQSSLAIAIANRSERVFIDRGYEMLRVATRRQAARGERAAIAFREPLEHADPGILHRSAVSLLADRTPSFEEALRSLRIPRTVIAGERTPIVPDLLPDDVPLVRITGAGHSMMSENPDDYASAIAAVVIPPSG
jgi:pimeloyl-ACP methyl ester carboxylesterase